MSEPVLIADAIEDAWLTALYRARLTVDDFGTVVLLTGAQYRAAFDTLSETAHEF